MRLSLALLITALGLGIQFFNSRTVMKVKLPQIQLSSLPKARSVPLVSLGNSRAMADWYWIQSVLFFAQHWLIDQQYNPMFPALDLVTDLQPYAREPYFLGGWMLCDNDVSCPHTRTLAYKATAWNHTDWEVVQNMAVLLFLELHENESAAGLIRIAKNRPGAPVDLAQLEGYFLTRGGLEERARAFYQELYETAPTPQLRAKVSRELSRYTMIAQLRQLQQALHDYVNTYNEMPPGVAAMSNFKGEALPLEDPFGGKYLIEDGLIKSNSEKEYKLITTRYIDKSPLEPARVRVYFGPPPPPDLKAAPTPGVLSGDVPLDDSGELP